MSIDSTAVAASEKVVASTALGESAGFDERWATWQARGEAHDRAFRRNLFVAAAVVILVVAALMYAVPGR
jgi:hypothetical protein